MTDGSAEESEQKVSGLARVESMCFGAGGAEREDLS